MNTKPIGWAALAGSSQPAIEPVCYLGLGHNLEPARDIERGQDFLFCAPNPNGIWPVLSGDDEEGSCVAVTVAVRCVISPTFQAFASGPLCAQDFCKLLARCHFQDFDLLTMDDS